MHRIPVTYYFTYKGKKRLDDFQGHNDLFNIHTVGFALCHIEQIYIPSSGGRNHTILTEIIYRIMSQKVENRKGKKGT